MTEQSDPDVILFACLKFSLQSNTARRSQSCFRVMNRYALHPQSSVIPDPRDCSGKASSNNFTFESSVRVDAYVEIFQVDVQP